MKLESLGKRPKLLLTLYCMLIQSEIRIFEPLFHLLCWKRFTQVTKWFQGLQGEGLCYLYRNIFGDLEHRAQPCSAWRTGWGIPPQAEPGLWNRSQGDVCSGSRWSGSKQQCGKSSWDALQGFCVTNPFIEELGSLNQGCDSSENFCPLASVQKMCSAKSFSKSNMATLDH